MLRLLLSSWGAKYHIAVEFDATYCTLVQIVTRKRDRVKIRNGMTQLRRTPKSAKAVEQRCCFQSPLMASVVSKAIKQPDGNPAIVKESVNHGLQINELPGAFFGAETVTSPC
jgi:hypothetical protein